ncbi:response regulator transcription factor [Shewanella gaetbuli]|uniref:Response regulator transcription factor n=1 Tax=Shewanella gaetbuli TaxID=220752 RepID=A0A9X1ZN37_9GAMM|nr:response regulator transcription factor [Shewanella gaetbuli]MCL1142525.1 response regulator transcription factor [Shewanella gaetbuli]
MRNILLIQQSQVGEFNFEQQLNNLGFKVTVVNNALQALVKLESNNYEVALVDLSLERLESFWLLATRKLTTTVIALAANNSTLEKISALEMGADDYLAKPFNLRELQLRLDVLKRRSHPSDFSAPTYDIRFNDNDSSITCAGSNIQLTNTEYKLFRYLFERKGKVVTKDELQQRVLHKKLGKFDRNLDMHISNTRRKLTQQNLPRDLINTVRGQGYSFNF